MTETSTGAEYISEAHVRHIMRYVQARDWLTNEKMIADAACGTGYGSKLLWNQNRMIVGLDFNDIAINEARKTATETILFIKTDLIERQIRNFDAVVCIETIEHVSALDGLNILTNFYRWLPLGGTLIISTPYCTHSGPSPITKQHLWEYSLTDFEQALVQAGFSVEVIKTERHEGQAGRLGYAMAKAIKQ